MMDDNTQLALNRGSGELIKPEARMPINIRTAIDDKADFRFIDDLQKQHGSALGFMYRQVLDNYIERGDILGRKRCQVDLIWYLVG